MGGIGNRRGFILSGHQHLDRFWSYRFRYSPSCSVYVSFSIPRNSRKAIAHVAYQGTNFEHFCIRIGSYQWLTRCRQSPEDQESEFLSGQWSLPRAITTRPDAPVSEPEIWLSHLGNADDLIRYSFCRVADDLVDEAPSVAEAEQSIRKLKHFLDISYNKVTDAAFGSKIAFVRGNFSPGTQSALLLLPTTYLSSEPLYELLEGFRMDLCFASNADRFPIQDERKLEVYGSRVAGTVAELCIELVYHHMDGHTVDCARREIIAAGHQMGIALQYINISRDIAVDASNQRVYLPSTWLKEVASSPEQIISNPSCPTTEMLRQRLLDKAMNLYVEARGAIERLPPEARGPMRVAVESYVEIGRVLRSPGYKVKHGRATVSKLRRLQVARHCLMR